MGILHNELRRSPLGRALKNALGDSTSTGQLERFGETLQPTINLWEEPDWAFLRGAQLWAFNVTQAAVAGEQAGAAVVNPAGSNRIVVVTAGNSSVAVAGATMNIALTTEAVITATYALFGGGGLAMPTRDSRIAGVALRQSLPQFWNGTNIGALITNILRIEQTRHDTSEFKRWISPPVVLSPGFALIAEDPVANEQIQVGMAGSIRPAFRGELAP